MRLILTFCRFNGAKELEVKKKLWSIIKFTLLDKNKSTIDKTANCYVIYRKSLVMHVTARTTQLLWFSINNIILYLHIVCVFALSCREHKHSHEKCSL